jgi:hypothetical protein
VTITPEEVRSQLLRNGYTPVPCIGKKPLIDAWQKLDPTIHEIERWSRTHPAAQNTGIITRTTPTFDIDILDPEAAAAIEELVRERFEERGFVLTRFGLAPKRCIPFRTDTPFAKITVNFIPPGGDEPKGEKFEFLCDGQQFVAYGTHPDTHKPYSWHADGPDEIKRDDLPYIHPEEAQALVDDAAHLIVEKFGYRLRPVTRPKGNGDDGGTPGDWTFTPDDLIDHDSLAALAMRLVKSGMGAGAAVNFLRSAVAGLANIDEERRQRRLREIPRMVSSAGEKLEEPKGPSSGKKPNGGDESRPTINPGDTAPAFSDEALALLFADRHAGNLQFVAAWSKWLSWAGTRWRFDGTLYAFDLARQIIREAAGACNKSKKTANLIASAKTVAAVERLSKSDRRLAATDDQWDNHPNIINTPTKDTA